MKDITDYFLSPSKARSSSEGVNSPKKSVLEVASAENVNTENKIKNDSSSMEAVEVQRKKGKKKRRRKPTDPEVHNVTELLSTNLNLISPNASGTKQQVVSSTKKNMEKQKGLKRKSNENIAKQQSNTTVDYIQSNNQTKTKTSNNEAKSSTDERLSGNIPDEVQENTQSPTLATRVDAFQFLMNSRNNIIGQNSEGKISKEENGSYSENNEKLGARKNLFKNWADQKGASKRKREEEEIEKCIDLKMKRRAKRLKELLQANKMDDTHADDCKSTLSKIKKKKVQRLNSSESESSNDLNTIKPNIEPINTPMAKITEIIEENAQDAIISTVSSSLQKKHKENAQNNLLNFFGVITNQNKEDIIEVFEDSSKKDAKEIIKIKMFTPQSTKKRTSLMALNRNTSKSTDSVRTEESNQEENKVKLKKKKHETKGIEKRSQRETNLNDSMEDFCSPKHNRTRNEINGSKEMQNKKLKKLRNVKDSDNTSEIISLNSCHRTKENWKNNSCKKKFSVNKDNNKKTNLNNVTEITSELSHISGEEENTNDSDIISIRAKRSKHCIVDDDSVGMTLDKTNKTKNHNLVTKQSMKAHNRKTHVINMQNIQDSEEGKVVKQNITGEGRTLRKRSIVNYKEMMNIAIFETAKREEHKKAVSSKNSRKSAKDDSVEKVELSSDSDHEELKKSKLKTSVKVAPVFLKSTPKPKINPEIIEARKKFLLSGIPDTLKKSVEKQKSVEDKEFDVFPAISHVQQKCDNKLWNLPKPELKLHYFPLPIGIQNSKCENLIIRMLPYKINLSTEVKKVKHMRTFLNEIKSKNPDYPVFKVFRQICEKNGKYLLKSSTTSKRTPKKRSKKSQRTSRDMPEVQSDLVISKEHEMWTEKYNPRSSDEILGNYSSVNKLKKWLEMWMNYSEEINARKRKRRNSNSESEFDSTDCDSRDSTRLPGNTMILYGPTGSGKTSAVYAIANELGFNVLELNASTKRTGKRLLQELQEATQSHQVRKRETNLLANMNPAAKGRKPDFNSKTVKKIDYQEKKPDQKDQKKMCILLLEDIDLIFEQDEGFLSSLSQLILTSKRPIILTTTDNSPAHVQKFMSQYECISFMPLSLQCLAVWLQIVCLVEGLFVDKYDLGNFLEYNKGDIRKTLLEVQFWCQGGGQLDRDRLFPLTTAGSSKNVGDLKVPDEELQIEISEDEVNNKENFVHKNCLGSFEVFRLNEEYSIPQKIDLGILWWNLSNILDVPNGAAERIQRLNNPNIELQKATHKIAENSNYPKLNSLSRLYDSLVLTDSLFSKVNCHYSNEPVVSTSSFEVLDSQELTERNDECNAMIEDLVQDLSHTLVNGSIENYRRIEGTSCVLNVAMPDSSERRWRANQLICEDFLTTPVPLSNILDRRSVALDYLPTMRDIARCEEKRASFNTKRGNRFRHYLRDLNVNFKQSACKLACNILNIENEQ